MLTKEQREALQLLIRLYADETAHASVGEVANPAEQAEAINLFLDESTVPEGWQMVPVEPTEEMIDAGCEIDARAEVQKRYAALYPDVSNPGIPAGEVLKLRYAAMLAAAPKPGDSNE